MMDGVTLAAQIAPIMKDGLLVPIKDGWVELREPKVMTVVVAELPDGATVIDMRSSAHCPESGTVPGSSHATICWCAEPGALTKLSSWN